MKARIITSLMALAALLAASCAKESGQKETAPLPQVPISVEASVSGLTKAVTDGLQTTFEANDQLTLYAWTGSNAVVPEKKVVSGVVNTFDGTAWTPASTMLWKNVSDAHYFLGISPARTVTSFTADPVSSSEDLLVATVLGDGIVAPQTVTAPPVALEFSHVMAWLKVNVKYRNQWGGVPEAVVTTAAATAGTIDYLTKTITPGTVATQTLAAATTAAEGYDATYSALCIPQGISTINFTIAGQTLVYTHSEDIVLEAGKVTTLTLLVGKDKIALENNTVSAWGEGEVNPDMGAASGILADATRPLTIKAKENGTTVTFTDRRSSGKVTWITSDGRSGTISLINNTVSLAAGQRVWFIGDGTNSAFGTGSESTSSRIALNKDCEVYGNIMSLLGPDFATATTLPGNNTFAYLFSGQTHLKNSAEEGLYLPATTLTEGCYKGLFKGCTGLSQVVVNATDISASNGLTDWVNGIAGAGFSVVTPDPKLWTMGGNLPWGATVYTQGESGLEAVYTTPTALATNLTYNGSAQTLINAGTAHKDGVVLEYSTNGTSWSTTVPKGTNAGNYNVYCRVQGGGVTSAALAVSIAAKTVANPTITLDTNTYTYNGSARTPAVTSVKDGSTTIPSGEYTVSYSNNTNAGTAKVTITDKSGGNYTVSGSKTFTINKANPTFSLSVSNVSFGASDAVNATKTVNITYNGDGTLSASSNNTGLVTVSRDNKTLTLTRKSAGSGSCTITVSASAGKNYNAPSNKTISVTLTALVPAGAIAGLFSVSATQKVYFSKGNLQLTGDNTWKFADNQWDYFGLSQSNNHRDLFGWGTGNNPNKTSHGDNYYDSFTDWGSAAASSIGTGWRTMTKNEWEYLLNTRTVNGGTGENKSFTLGQSVNGKVGLVLYPDNYTGSVYTGSNWSAFQTAGCVFLPACGDRDTEPGMTNGGVKWVNEFGFYWTSTEYDSTYAYRMSFGYSTHVDRYYRRFGSSVRLVHNE